MKLTVIITKLYEPNIIMEKEGKNGKHYFLVG